MNTSTTAAVREVNLASNSSASIVQFGDRKTSKLLNIEIAILQNKTTYFAGEPHFRDYKVFTAPVPAQLHTTVLPCKVHKQIASKLAPLPSLTDAIEIDCINIVSSSNASSIQFGNGRTIFAENRLKEFVQLF